MNKGAEFFEIQAEILIEKGCGSSLPWALQGEAVATRLLLQARLLPASCNCPVTTQPPPARAHRSPCTALDCILRIEQEE